MSGLGISTGTQAYLTRDVLLRLLRAAEYELVLAQPAPRLRSALEAAWAVVDPDHQIRDEIHRYRQVWSLEVPLRTVSRINQKRGLHWSRTSGRAKSERASIRLAWYAAQIPTPPGSPPWRVTLTRVAPRPLDDDNLRSSLKAVRDEIASLLAVDDRVKDPVVWFYEQATHETPKTYAVRVSIETLPSEEDR